MADDNIPIRRRNFLMGAGTAVAASLAPPVAAEAQTAPSPASAPPDAEPLLTLTPTEHAFFVAAADTLIPADDLSPSGSNAASPLSSTASWPVLMAAARGFIATGRSPRPSPSSATSCRSIRANFSAPALPRPTSGRARPTARISTASPTPTAKPR